MILYSVTALLWLLSVDVQESSAENTTYVVALLGQDIQNGTVNPDITYELVMINKAPSAISVDITGVDGLIETLPVTDKTVHPLDQAKGLNGSEYSNKSFIVSSQDGFFTLQVFTRRQDHNYVEGLLAIPIEQLKGPHQPAGKTIYNYVVASFCDIGGYCQLAVAALNDNTAVSIKLPTNVEEITLCRGKGYFRSSRDTTITLNKYDALQLETTYDLTGTNIYSSDPVVVFAGSRNVTNEGVVAHTMEQLVPSSHWGTEYIVHTLGSNGYGDILKIVSHWSDTKVTMKGFSPFFMKNRYETAVRRLDNGSSSHIQASHPIQVIQISGLTYGTENETSALSMTVVPSVQNAFTKPVTVSCQGEDPVEAQFFIVQGKLTTGTDINGQNQGTPKKVKYSNYKIDVMKCSNKTYIITNTVGSPLSGVMKCGSATMPTTILYNANVSGTTAMKPNYTGGVCYEGGKAASTIFDITSGTATPHTLDLQEHPEHALELRVRTCGEAVLQFMMKGGDMNTSLILSVTHKQVIVTKCILNCSTIAVVNDNDFHSGASAEWDCAADMAFFWFLQKTIDNEKAGFCFGMGKFAPDGCKETDTNQYFEVPQKFEVVKLMGVVSDAAFTWDFVHTDGCDRYESDWRCSDRWTNCSVYGTNFCNNCHFSSFASFTCAKFCGKCFADSYGRKFILKVPYLGKDVDYQKSCNLLVSPLNKQTNVAVTFTDPISSTEKVVHGSRHENGERYYECSAALFLSYGQPFHTIISDDDVAVVVMLTFNGEVKSYRIYPVDTFDTEFMMLDYNKDIQEECNYVTEHKNVQYANYFSENMREPHLADSEKSDLNRTSRLRTINGNEMSGSLVVFDKPSSVFCGDDFERSNDASYYYQLLPTSSWSSEYVIPAFDEVAINRPFEAKLLFVSNADNTIVNISGGFDALRAIYNRGDLESQDIDAGAAYRVTASQTIGVGIYIYDPSDTTKSSFHVLPPSQNLHDTVVTSVPNKVIEDVFNVPDIKTYFVDENLGTSAVLKAADDAGDFYRHVRQNGAVLGMTVVKSDNEKWFIIPGNIKSRVQHMEVKTCNMSLQGVADNIDNDCDGLQDEDVCYKGYGVYREVLPAACGRVAFNRDLDGGFGEDCSEMLEEPAVISKPEDPWCLEINKPLFGCWTPCTCKCSWIEKLKAWKNMSEEELEEERKKNHKQIQDALYIDKKSTTRQVAKKKSTFDKRRSSASIGYIGIALFALLFGIIFIMDISSLARDARILLANLREGYERLTECFKRRDD